MSVNKSLIISILGIASASLLGAAAHATPSTLTDAQILGLYYQVNSFDIETALLGTTRARNPKVRLLAQHVMDDHIGVRQGIDALARECGVTPSLPDARHEAAARHADTMKRLAGLQGDAFDQAYVVHEVAFHTAAIDAVRTTLLPSAQCSALKMHLRDVLPAFEHHLMQTRQLAAPIAVSVPATPEPHMHQ